MLIQTIIINFTFQISELSKSGNKTNFVSVKVARHQNCQDVLYNELQNYFDEFQGQKRRLVHSSWPNRKQEELLNCNYFENQVDKISFEQEIEIDQLALDNQEQQSKLQYRRVIQRRPQKGVRKYKVTAEEFENQNKAIYQIVSQEPTIGLKEVVNILLTKYNILMTKSSVHKRILDQLGLSFKPIENFQKPRKVKNDHQTLRKRKQFLKKIQGHRVDDMVACGISKFTGSLLFQSAWLPKQSDDSQMDSFLKKVITPEDTMNLFVIISSNQLLYYQVLEQNLTPSVLKGHLSQVLGKAEGCRQKRAVLISESICYNLQGYMLEKPIIKVQGCSNANTSNEDKLEQCKRQLEEELSSYSLHFISVPSFSPQLDPSISFFQLAHRKFKAYKVLNKKVKSRDQIQKGIDQVIRYIPQEHYPIFFETIHSVISQIQQKKNLQQ